MSVIYFRSIEMDTATPNYGAYFFPLATIAEIFSKNKGFGYSDAFTEVLQNAFTHLKTDYQWEDVPILLTQQRYRDEFRTLCAGNPYFEIFEDVIYCYENGAPPNEQKLYHELVQDYNQYKISPKNLLREIQIEVPDDTIGRSTLQCLKIIMCNKHPHTSRLLVGRSGAVSWYRGLTRVEKADVALQLQKNLTQLDPPLAVGVKNN